MRVGLSKLCKPRAQECLGKSWLIEGPLGEIDDPREVPKQVLREEPGSSEASPMVSTSQCASTLVARSVLRRQQGSELGHEEVSVEQIPSFSMYYLSITGVGGAEYQALLI